MHLSQLRQREAELKTSDVIVKVVTFDADVLAQAYRQKMELPWPILNDFDQTLYGAYGMQRASWWDIYRPSSLWKYLKLIANGQKPGKPGSDWRQLGGDVLIDPNGIVRMHYISSDPHDRPSVDAILALVREFDRFSR